MKSKWQSRKFWDSQLGVLVGMITTVGGGATATDTVVQCVTVAFGAIITIASILGYLHVEGKIDVERAKKEKQR